MNNTMRFVRMTMLLSTTTKSYSKFIHHSYSVAFVFCVFSIQCRQQQQQQQQQRSSLKKKKIIQMMLKWWALHTICYRNFFGYTIFFHSGDCCLLVVYSIVPSMCVCICEEVLPFPLTQYAEYTVCTDKIWLLILNTLCMAICTQT